MCCGKAADGLGASEIRSIECLFHLLTQVVLTSYREVLKDQSVGDTLRR